MSQARPMLEPDFRERYGVLLDIGRILAGTLEPDQLYRTIYEQASRILETTGFYISIYEADRDEARIAFYADRGEIAWPDITYRGSESRAIREARSILEELGDPARAVMLLGPESDEEVTRSVVAAPLIHNGQILGVISAQSYRPQAYAPPDLEILEAIADVAAVALANSRAVVELERQRQESGQLEEIGRALTASLELGEVLHRIVSATRELVSADGSAVWLLRPDGMAEIAMSAGDSGLPVGTTVPVTDDLRQRFTAGRAPVVLDQSNEADILPPSVREQLGAESAMAVPLVAESELIGALAVSHVVHRDYSARDIRLMERLGFHAAIAVANARLHEQVHLLSLTDPLTGLPNRRHMDMFLKKEFAAAERGRALTMVIFDLDDFKIFNDTHGHQAGDEALRRFARILDGRTRAMHLSARYGGDEFVSILSDMDEDGARILVDRIADGVRKDPVVAHLGASAGIAAYHPDMLGPEDLIRAADEALYRVKAGRQPGRSAKIP
jgi:diguanylate cyclase (GGDEF)-like protein